MTRERDTARIELEAAAMRINQLEGRIPWYRRQATAEARFYPLLSHNQRFTNDKGSP